MTEPTKLRILVADYTRGRAGDRDDGVGQCRFCGGGHAAWRACLLATLRNHVGERVEQFVKATHDLDPRCNTMATAFRRGRWAAITMTSWIWLPAAWACTPPERYATMFFGDYDDATRKLRYANCGHNPPLLLRASGDVEWLQPTAPVIAAIYSDGVTDAAGPLGGELGESGLLSEFRGEDLSPQLLAARIAAYSPGEQFDDMTLVIARALLC